MFDRARRPDAESLLTLSYLLNQAGKRDEAIAALEQAHEKYPRNLQLVDTLASMALAGRDWKSLEKYESWLQTSEGDDGTVWKSFRAQRLLATSTSVDDKQFQEAVSLIDSIVRERPRWSKAHYLQGEVALRTNKLDDAAAAFARSWQYGARRLARRSPDRFVDPARPAGRWAAVRCSSTRLTGYLSGLV